MNVRNWLRAEWDRVTGIVLIVLGVVLVVSGYVGAKQAAFAVDALTYLASGGVGGLFSLGLGVGLLVSADLHDEWGKLDRLEAAIRCERVPGGNEVELDLQAESPPDDSRLQATPTRL